jgi:hypothetical protein
MCLVAAMTVTPAAQGRGGQGSGPAPAAAVDPRDFSGFWELPPDGRDGRNIPAASLAEGVTRSQLDAVAAHDAK